MEKRCYINVSAFVFLFLAATPSIAAINIGVLPLNQTADLNSTVTVSLQISGLGNLSAPSLGTFDLNVGFDSTWLAFDSAVFGDPLIGNQLDPARSQSTISFVNPGVGTIEMFELSLDNANQLNSLQPDGFVLGSITFTAIKVGTSSLVLSINALGDADGNSLSAGLQNGDVTVRATSAAPEPSSAAPIAAMTTVIVILRRFGRGSAFGRRWR